MLHIYVSKVPKITGNFKKQDIYPMKSFIDKDKIIKLAYKVMYVPARGVGGTFIVISVVILILF